LDRDVQSEVEEAGKGFWKFANALKFHDKNQGMLLKIGTSTEEKRGERSRGGDAENHAGLTPYASQRSERESTYCSYKVPAPKTKTPSRWSKT